MGRPLNKKYFGARNAGSTGSFNQLVDPSAKLDGQAVVSVGSITAGTYTAGSPGLTFTLPLGGEATTNSRATGTAIMTAVSASLGGTQTKAYLPGAGSITLVTALGTATFTPTLSTGSNTITNTNGTSVTVTSGSYIQGTSFTTGGTVTTTSGLAANTTYYVAATTSSSTTVTLASSYANAMLGTAITFTGGSTAISNGAVTIGTYAGAVASVAVASGGSFTNGITTTATATSVVSPNQGAGLTLTVTYGISGATITNAGAGYVTESITTNITATTAGASPSLGTITATGTAGQLSFQNAQTAGTFFVGQLVTLTGAGNTITSPSYVSGQAFVVTATNGTSTVTIAAIVNGVVTPIVQTTGAYTGTSLNTAGTFTLANGDGFEPGAVVVTSGTAGTISAGTYYVVTNANGVVSLSSTYAGFFNPTTSTVLAPTTTTPSSVTATASQNLAIAVSGSGGGALSAVLSTEVTSGYSGRYPSILVTANVGGQTYENANIIKQESSHNYRVLVNGGTYPGSLCKLVNTSASVAGTMTINATDSAGNSYYVYKLTNHKAYLQRNVLATGQSWQFANEQAVPWNLTSPTLNSTVTIDNS